MQEHNKYKDRNNCIFLTESVDTSLQENNI